MIATDGVATIADPVNRPGPVITTRVECSECGHSDAGDICPVCDCGDPTSVVGPHRTAAS